MSIRKLCVLAAILAPWLLWLSTEQLSAASASSSHHYLALSPIAAVDAEGVPVEELHMSSLSCACGVAGWCEHGSTRAGSHVNTRPHVPYGPGFPTFRDGTTGLVARVALSAQIVQTSTTTHTLWLPLILRSRVPGFAPPVDVQRVPHYQAFDLNPQVGVIQSNAGPKFNGFTAKCTGDVFIPGTSDNHFGYDYGVGNCGRKIEGEPVYGMSVGFDGVVISEGFGTPHYAFKVYYGQFRCTDGVDRHIVIQFGHSIPTVRPGDRVNADTQVAAIETTSHEIEVKVISSDPNNLMGGTPIDPRLIGLEPLLDHSVSF